MRKLTIFRRRKQLNTAYNTLPKRVVEANRRPIPVHVESFSGSYIRRLQRACDPLECVNDPLFLPEKREMELHKRMARTF
jgi:hypothetical protein